MSETLFENAQLRVLVASQTAGNQIDPPPMADVSKLPGARWVANKAWSLGPSGSAEAVGVGWVVAGCVQGPSTRFAPGIESVLFEKTRWLTIQSAELKPDKLDRSQSEFGPQQSFEIWNGSEGDRSLRLAHLLTFVGPESDVLICSLSCSGVEACGDVGLRLEGEPSPAPEPSLLVRAVFAAAQTPMLTAGALGAALVIVAGLLLWRRPRPRRS